MPKMTCDWCEALGKSVEDFQPGDLVAWDMVPHTYWGDGKWYYQKAVYCPMCGRPFFKNLETALSVNDAESIFHFAENRMNLSETARAMFIHRNTLIYRLDKIQSATGLNPCRFYDLCKLVPMAKYILDKKGSEAK